MAAIVAMAMPAWASGSFTWTATIKTGLNSRNWSTDKAGNVTITATMSCDPNTKVYYIMLIRNRTGLPDHDYANVKYTCGSSQTYTWKSVPKATYHFEMTKATDGVKISGHGTTSYA